VGWARPEVKWHLHNLYAKTSTGSREELVRLVLNILACLV
jgi:DNA-binding CsgD family transcriptional regulator